MKSVLEGKFLIWWPPQPPNSHVTMKILPSIKLFAFTTTQFDKNLFPSADYMSNSNKYSDNLSQLLRIHRRILSFLMRS